MGAAKQHRASRSVSVAGELARSARRAAERATGSAWPSPRWQQDPVGFARTILGVDVWSFQAEFLEAVRDNRHVSVKGGRKIGKDFAVAILALWWFASFEDARVFCLAPTLKQVDGILYREIRKLFAGSGRCLACKTQDPDGPRPCPHSAILTGKIGEHCTTGIKAPDLREIVGQTSISEGGLRGWSGARILAIEDEASDIKDDFDTALIGNLAGQNCKRILISNPTRSQGFFYRSHHEERELYKRITCSSEDTPNALEKRTVFPGLADHEWLAERSTAWGKTSPLYRANVLGEFVRAEEGQLVSLETITASETAWQLNEIPQEGRLYVSCDPAGDGYDGDETAFCARRGNRVLALTADRGLTSEAIAARIIGLIETHRVRGDEGENRPTVVIDRDGRIGARTYDAVRAKRDNDPSDPYNVYGFRGAEPPKRMADTYRLSRDLMYGALADWLRTGGEIPPDAKLEGELLAMRWVPSTSNKQVLLPKSELRDKLKRSPDRADALALSVVAERPRAKPANDNWRPTPETVVQARASLPATPIPTPRGIPSESYGLVRVRRRR